MRRSYIVGGSVESHQTIKATLVERYDIELVDRLPESLEANRGIDIIFIDILHLLDLSKRESSELPSLVRSLRKRYPQSYIIILSDIDTLRSAVVAVKAGADDYLSYPIESTELQYVLENLANVKRRDLELDYLRDKFWKDDSVHLVRTSSEKMKGVYQKIRAVAPTRTTVLLTGETGVGKGVLARLIHRHSDRSDKQFISIHCGAIADSLIESELFGHEKGAFTGAHKLRKGKFEIAHGGTLFLDEMATITPAAQIKLLQVLQDRTIQRVGSEDEMPIDVRIIAATNQDLSTLVKEGQFRSDLFYRLNVFPIEVPTLSQRSEDLSLLVDTFLQRLNQLYGKEIQSIHEETLQALTSYSWPGNIRELENIIERAHILETSDVLTPESLPHELLESLHLSLQLPLDTALPLSEVRKKAIEDVEERYLADQLRAQKGKIGMTAEVAGISTRQLNKLMQKYALKRADYL